jgi:hypothetical protein
MDLISLFKSSNRRSTNLILTGLLIFIAGWQTGRVMSPYYAAHPITFTETSNAVIPTASDLVALRDTDQITPEPVVAGAATTTSNPTSGQFVGSVNSDKYHHLDCPTWKRIKPENQIWFDSQQEAEAAGYEPTVCTTEKLNI